MNSSLFYWWFIILSDCRHLNSREVENFPLGYEQMTSKNKTALTILAHKIMIDIKSNAVRKTINLKKSGKVIYDEFYPKHSKQIADEIDRVFAMYWITLNSS